jgi:uncharacterized protein
VPLPRDPNDALVAAVRVGDVDGARHALDAGANPRTPIQELVAGDRSIEEVVVSPLAVAARCGHESVALLLLDRGVDACRDDGFAGESLLHLAVERRLEQLVDRLLACGVRDPGALDLASRQGDLAMVAQLVAFAPATSTALAQACLYGHCDVAELLVARGAEVDGADPLTPVAAAAWGDRVELVEWLLSRGANLARHGRRALELAANAGRTRAVSLLLSKGVAVDERNAYGWTPLMLAAFQGQTETVRVLLAHGADRTLESGGKRPIDFARNGKYAAIVALLSLLTACGATTPCPTVTPIASPAAIVAPSASAHDALSAPLTFGQTFRFASAILGEQRVINVYVPPGYARGEERFPVLFALDGGIEEDFPHVAGVIDVSIRNEVIRPLIVVGIENTERRRDLVSKSAVEAEQRIAPHAGGTGAFRRFLREELKPEIAKRYRVSDESAVVGESFAGLFVLETFLDDPELFDTYIAIDPSVWWNGGALVKNAPDRFARWSAKPKRLFVATADAKEMQEGVGALMAALADRKPEGVTATYEPLPAEHHATIFPVAEVRAYRALFALPPK